MAEQAVAHSSMPSIVDNSRDRGTRDEAALDDVLVYPNGSARAATNGARRADCRLAASPAESTEDTAHVVQFYETDAFLLDRLSRFIGDALRAGDAGVVVATEEHRVGLDQRLLADGLDPSAAQARGQYVALDAATTLASFMVDGLPDPARFVAVIDGLLAPLIERHRQAYVFGEMVALLAAVGNQAGVVRLEALWNDLQKVRPFTLFCAYPMHGLSGAAYAPLLTEVCGEHSRVIPAESYMALEDPEDRLRAIAVLQQKAQSLEAEIAERKRAEEDLRRREQELDDFVEHAAVGLHRVGADGRILWANQAELNLLGYTREEYIGRPIAEFHADQPVIQDILSRLSAREELHDYAARLRAKDGSIKHVLISSNVLWEDGRFVHTRCFTRDITERVHAEQGRALLIRAGEVLASSLEWDETLDHVISLTMPMLADFGFFDVVEMDGQVRRIARAHDDLRRQTVLDASRWAPATHTDLNVCALTSGETGFHPTITDEWLQRVAAGPEHLAVMRDLAFHSMVTVPLRHGERTLGALTLFYADSGRHHTEADLALIDDLGRRAAMAVQNARLFAETRAAVRARDEFLSVASHELRTPLTSLRGHAQLLLRKARRDGMLDPQAVLAGLARVETQSDRLARLLEQLLDTSRIDAGKLQLERRDTDLAALAEGLVEDARSRTDRHQIAVQVAGPLVAWVDPLRLEQVLTNLLDNAIRYSPGGGPIDVSIERGADGAAEIAVRDRGRGIQPERRERIFDRFYQAHRDDHTSGLGLGLYISHQIVELHGGEIRAEFPSDGGTRFFVRLPAESGSAISA